MVWPRASGERGAALTPPRARLRLAAKRAPTLEPRRTIRDRVHEQMHIVAIKKWRAPPARFFVVKGRAGVRPGSAPPALLAVLPIALWSSWRYEEVPMIAIVPCPCPSRRARRHRYAVGGMYGGSPWTRLALVAGAVV